MKLYCHSCRAVCLVVTPTPEKGVPRQHRPGARMVCAECLERYEAADAMAIKDSVRDPALDKLRDMFGMT